MTANQAKRERIQVQVTGDEQKPIPFEEAAEYLNISKSYLYRLTSKSIIAHFKPGGKKIFFDRKDLDRYLQRNRVSSIEEIRRDVDNTKR